MRKGRYLALVDEGTRDVAEKFLAAIREGRHQQVSLWSRLMAGYIAQRMRSAIRKGNIKPFR